jgi:hypothetical protein
MRRPRRSLVGAVVLGVVALAAWLSAPAPRSWAAAPTVYGWWNEANAGLPVPPPAPPGVPADGLYVANGVSGPTAIAALTIAVPSGAAMGPLVLHVSGSPLMVQPPVACPLRGPFKPAEGGAWSDRPTYDCNQAQKVGTVDSAKTKVSFDASPFLRDGAVAIAILAGGPTDQVAFSKPGPDTLPISTEPGATPGGTPSPVDSGSPAIVPPGFSQPTDTAPLPFPGESATPPALATPGNSPVAAGPTAQPAVVPGSRSAVPARAVSAAPSGWRARAGEILGAAAIILALIAWSEGYGLLGGRVPSLASPLSGPAARQPSR